MSLKREILKEWAVGANLPLGLLPAEAVGSWFLEQRSHPGPWSRDNFCGEAQHTDSGCVPSRCEGIQFVVCDGAVRGPMSSTSSCCTVVWRV